MASVLIAVAVIVIAFVYPYITDITGPPRDLPPKFERVEIKVGETVLVKDNPVKLISIEEEIEKEKIEVYNETAGETIVVPLSLRSGTGFKYKNIVIIPLSSTIEEDRITFVIAEVAYSEADM